MRCWRWTVLVVLLLGGGLWGLYLARGSLLPAAAAWLDVGGPPQQADDVMLLNGDENTRPFLAAALIKAGWARRVLVAEVAPSPAVAEKIILPEHDLNRRVLIHCGMAEGDIVVLPGQADATYDEALALAAWLDTQPDRRLLLVTSGYHTRRARWTMERALGERAERMAVVSAPCDDFRPDNWWQSERGFTTITGEYLKLGFYSIRYGYAGYAAAAATILIVGVVLAWRRRRRRRRENLATPARGGE